MSKLKLFIVMALVAVGAVFAFINAEKAEVNLFWAAQAEIAVAFIILISFIVGMAVMALIDLPGRFRSGKSSRELRAKLKAAEEERDLLQKRVSELAGGEEKGTR